MTLDTYSDLFEDDLDDVAARMQSAAATGPNDAIDISGPIRSRSNRGLS